MAWSFSGGTPRACRLWSGVVEQTRLQHRIGATREFEFWQGTISQISVYTQARVHTLYTNHMCVSLYLPAACLPLHLRSTSLKCSELHGSRGTKRSRASAARGLHAVHCLLDASTVAQFDQCLPNEKESTADLMLASCTHAFMDGFLDQAGSMPQLARKRTSQKRRWGAPYPLVRAASSASSGGNPPL